MKQRLRRILALALGACLLLGLSVHGTEPEYVTRGQFVQQLYALRGNGAAPSGRIDFADVGGDSPWFAAVSWAKAQGISNGYEGGWFRPSVLITREQAASMLYRLSAPEEPAGEDPLTAYTDAAEVPAWFRPAVAWAVEAGFWFSGSSTLLKAKDCVTAEECAVLMERLDLGGMRAASWEEGFYAGQDVTMEITALSASGATVRLRNNTADTAHYGADYFLYRKVNGGWYRMFEDMAFILILYGIAPGESGELAPSWENLAPVGALPPGEYRLTKTVTVGETPYLLASDFTIK